MSKQNPEDAPEAKTEDAAAPQPAPEAEIDIPELNQLAEELGPDGDGEDESADPKDAEIAALTGERDELRDKLMRALAETENVRRRAERDRKDAEAYAGTKLARDILPVHDNLARALAAADELARAAASGLIEGVELTQRELISAFGRHKIEKVEPEKGDKFDPNLHQAMFEAPVPGAPNGSVIEVMQAGFTISGRLLRPALVGVAKGGQAEAPAAEPEKS